MMKPNTPFPTSGYYGTAYFCDREAEVEQLKRNARGGESTTLVALRRMGKTALIRHLQSELQKEYLGVYVDILPTESINELLNSLATGIAAMKPEHSSLGSKIWKFLKSLRPVVSYDSLSGTPTLSFNQSPEQGRNSIGELFDFLENQSTPVLLAIDEFQQILSYPETQVDAWLRSRIQELSNVRFIFSGSQQHLMNELFADPSRPFYRSTQFLKLEKINRDVYLAFIAEKFKEHRVKIGADTIDSILDWTEGYTYYVQLLCNRIFLSASNHIPPESWKEEAMRLLKEQEFVFYSYRDGLTSNQWQLLKAIAREDQVYEPTSGDFSRRNELGSSASILRALRSLQKKELIYADTDADGTSFYAVYDVLFKRWISR